MAKIAATAYGGRFADATFVAFASPNISNAEGILNIGFENDPVYKAVGLYKDFASSLDNLVPRHGRADGWQHERSRAVQHVRAYGIGGVRSRQQARRLGILTT